MERLLPIVMLACAAGFAQTPAKSQRKAAPAARPAAVPGAVQKRPIATLSVEGTRIFTREQVIAVSGLKVGQSAGKSEFEAARDRLVASGAFESVSYRYTPTASGEAIAATFEVAEVEQVYPVEFLDLHVSSLELDSVLRTKDPLYSREKLPATRPVLDRYTKWIQEFLVTKGNQEKIMGEVAPAPGGAGEFAIVFRPARPLPTVAQVTFQGNELIPQEKLREAITGAVGATYTEDSFRQTLASVIRPLYETKGYLKVRFPELKATPAEDVKGLHVFVTVQEGVSYELGKLTIEGPTPIPADTLLKASELKTGQLADMTKVNEGVERIRRAVRREGYLEVRVLADRKLDDEKKQASISVRVDPGPQFTMGKLKITGLDINAEAEIRRIWNQKEGKPFNPEYPDLFLRRIREMALFDNLGATKAEYQLNQRDRSADVTLTFAGGGRGPRPGRGGRGPVGD
jgi:outer membrane protein assembly factor BamA